jgi:hypothetical protein
MSQKVYPLCGECGMKQGTCVECATLLAEKSCIGTGDYECWNDMRAYAAQAMDRPTLLLPYEKEKSLPWGETHILEHTPDKSILQC